MTDSASPKQYLNVLKAMWHIVDRHFDAKKILTPAGHALVQTYAIKAAHPEMPYAMHFLSMLCSLVNGVRSELFPSSESPFFHLFFNINYSQTRKSSITGNGDAFGDQLDKHVSKTIKERFEHLANSGDDPSGTQSQASPKVMSAVIHSATPAEFFHRCAGDFDQVENVDKLGHDKLRGRHNFGVLVNLDEAYDFLQSFGLLSDDSKAGAKGGRGGVNPNQSALNKLMQYGQASRATKSCGSFGAAGSPTVSCGIASNLHPSQYAPMERGELGSHHAATKERATIATGRPVQPHGPLPADYQLPPGFDRFKWVPLMPDIAAVLELTEGASSPDDAARSWERANPDPSAVGGEVVGEATYLPDAHGFKVKLPDGVDSQVRFRLAPATDKPSGFEAEWRISNRDFPTPAAHNLQICAARVFKYFDKPHMKIGMAVAAKAAFQSYMGAYNVQGYLAREKGDINRGARLGAAPWQLGELASMLCVFDLFCGKYDGTEELAQKNVRIDEEHIVRAALLLNVVHRLKDAAVGTRDEADGELSATEAALAKQQAIREETLRYCQHGGQAFDGLFSQNAFDNFDVSGDASAAARASGDVGEKEDEAADADDAKSAAEPDEPEQALEQDLADAPAAVAAVAADEVPIALTIAEVKSIQYGYGVDGASVQAELLSAELTDRMVMQKTLLCGKPAITSKQACDKIQSRRRGEGRKALSADSWVKVMEAGAQQCTVIKFENKKLLLKEIPDNGNERIKYHNELMTLCGLSLRHLVDAMKVAKGKISSKASGSKRSADGLQEVAKKKARDT